jgi:hypothetical protein
MISRTHMQIKTGRTSRTPKNNMVLGTSGTVIAFMTVGTSRATYDWWDWYGNEW